MVQNNYKLPLLVEQKDGSFQTGAGGGSLAPNLISQRRFLNFHLQSRLFIHLA